MKKENWKQKLIEYIEGCHNKKFSYGFIDCCTFCADGVFEMTGIDYMIEFREQYKNKNQAKKALKKIGSGTLLKTMRDKLGKPTKIARLGDVAFMWGKDGPTLGLCLGSKSIFIGEDSGGSLVEVPSIGLRFFKVE